MIIKNSWHWCRIPYQTKDKKGIYKVTGVLMLIKQTPYTKFLISYYGIGFTVDLYKVVEFS